MALSNVERQPRVHDRRDRRTRHQQWHDAIATIITLRNAWQAWRDAIPEALEASPTAERLDEILRSATGLRPRLTAAVGQCRRMDPSRNTVDLPCRSLRNGPGAAPTYAQPGHHHRLDCTTEDLDSRTREDRQARVMWRGRWPGMTGQAERSRGHDRCLAGRYRRDALGGCAPADAEASAPAASSS